MTQREAHHVFCLLSSTRTEITSLPYSKTFFITLAWTQNLNTGIADFEPAMSDFFWGYFSSLAVLDAAKICFQVVG